MWRTYLKIDYDGNISFFKKKNLFFLLLVVLNVRYFSPMGSKVPKYMIACGKIGDRNPALAVLPFSFVCEFLI